MLPIADEMYANEGWVAEILTELSGIDQGDERLLTERPVMAARLYTAWQQLAKYLDLTAKLAKLGFETLELTAINELVTELIDHTPEMKLVVDPSMPEDAVDIVDPGGKRHRVQNFGGLHAIQGAMTGRTQCSEPNESQPPSVSSSP